MFFQYKHKYGVKYSKMRPSKLFYLCSCVHDFHVGLVIRYIVLYLVQQEHQGERKKSSCFEKLVKERGENDMLCQNTTVVEDICFKKTSRFGHRHLSFVFLNVVRYYQVKVTIHLVSM